VARSYTDVGQAEKIRVEGWTYSPEHLRAGDKVLLVDDIFDTGNTVNFLAEIILQKGIPRKDLKVAVHDYKFFHDKPRQHPVQPDYWCRKHELSVHDEETWIHYLSHELLGLQPEELEEHYFASDGSLREVLPVPLPK
jgi:hypoxanthine phosphoribosyltransferase